MATAGERAPFPPSGIGTRRIAALAIFLAADSAKAISGQIVPIDKDMQQA